MSTKKPAKILVVDDESSIRQSLSAILEDEGFDVFMAHDGATALELIGKELPDAVLLDIWMPGQDGLEVLKEIRTQHPDLKIVMMSAYDGVNERKQAMESGADLFLGKPLNIKSIREALKTIQTEPTKN